MSDPKASDFQVIALVASAGGHAAVATVLRDLPAGFRIPILVMQHLGPESTSTVDMYRKRVPMPVEQLRGGEGLKSGTVLVAPPRMFVELLRSQHGGPGNDVHDLDAVQVASPRGRFILEQ